MAYEQDKTMTINKIIVTEHIKTSSCIIGGGSNNFSIFSFNSLFWMIPCLLLSKYNYGILCTIVL